MKHLLFSLLLLVPFAASARRYESVSFTHEGLSVSARITFPDGNGPYRTIIVVPGSGANDKDGTIPMYGGNANCLYPGLVGDTLRPYKGLSDALADSGFAVMTYDKVEYSYPTGLGVITLRKLWFPVLSGMSYLRSRSDIRGNELILLGHSEGSTLIPAMAFHDAGVSALISLAGPRRSTYDTIFAFQLLQVARTCGGDTALAISQGTQLIQYFSAIRAGNSAGLPPFAGVSAAVWTDYVRMADSVVKYYNAFPQPKLFIGLGADLNVPVATELTRFRAEVSGRADFYEVAGLNHYLSTATDPAVSEILTDTIVYWLRHQLPKLGITAPAASGASVFTASRNGDSWLLKSRTEQLRRVTLYDSNGRIVFGAKISGLTYELRPGALATGIYSLDVQGASTREVIRLNL